MFVSDAITPSSYHLDLYRYWDRSRGSSPVAFRRDIDPLAILPLLPHLGIVDRDGESYRWRLMGTALAADFGRDLTGQRFGGYVAPTPLVQAMIKTFDHVLADSQPAFETSVYETRLGNLQSVSRLLLPLAVQNGVPAMVIFSRVTRFQFGGSFHDDDQLKAAPGNLVRTHDIHSIEQLRQEASGWDRGTCQTTKSIGFLSDPSVPVIASQF